MRRGTTWRWRCFESTQSGERRMRLARVATAGRVGVDDAADRGAGVLAERLLRFLCAGPGGEEQPSIADASGALVEVGNRVGVLVAEGTGRREQHPLDLPEEVRGSAGGAVERNRGLAAVVAPVQGGPG